MSCTSINRQVNICALLSVEVVLKVPKRYYLLYREMFKENRIDSQTKPFFWHTIFSFMY